MKECIMTTVHEFKRNNLYRIDTTDGEAFAVSVQIDDDELLELCRIIVGIERQGKTILCVRAIHAISLDEIEYRNTKEYDADRKYGYSWNVLDTTFYQISYFARPQGQLLNDLDKAVDDMDAELPTSEVVAKGKAFLEKLLAMPKEELAADLYFVDTLVSTKRRSSLKNMQENFMSVYKEATEAIQTENYERSAVRLLYIFYEAYFYNDVQDDINVILSHALEKASGKSMEDASEILYNAMDKIMEGDLEPDEDDLEEISAEAIEQIQGMAASLQEEIMKAQADMQAAMMRGDMAEYMRLAQELQQKMMQQALGGQQ